MKRRRRTKPVHIMGTVTPLTPAEGSKPCEIQIETQNVIDVRPKLQHLIAGLNNQRAEAELAFLRDFSCDLAGLKVDFDPSFVDIVFSKYTSATQAADQITRRITALGEIATIIDKHFNDFKQTNHEGLMAVLKRKLDKLKAERCSTGKGVRFTGQRDSPTRG